jgi:glycosyltransferase involved in cell wall biosynthesis
MLDSLEQQVFRDFEYIVVDGLYDKRKDEVQKLFKGYSFPIVYVKDKSWFHSEEENVNTRPGPSSARNTGIIHARGELLVFHDDNTWLPPNWLSRHIQAFNLGFDGMAGLSHGTHELSFIDKCPSCAKPKQQTIQLEGLNLTKDYREGYDRDKFVVLDKDTGKIIETYNILPIGWLYSCNMSIRTEAILNINGFPEEFCGQMGSEDSFASVCLQRLGAKLVLDKKSYVIHISDEHHISFNDMFKFTNKEVMLKDGKMHFSNEKYVEDLIFKEVNRYRNNPHLNLREMREQKLMEN